MSASLKAPAAPPARIGRYEIRGELGRGMMGVVYEAFDPTLDRSVALKTVQLTFQVSQRDRESFEQRFFAEARAAAALQHPNIVVIHDLGRDEETGTLYMAQERLHGRNLAELTDGHPLPWREAVRVASRLAAALQAAHDRGIVHRDVKPANVVLQPDGQPKVLDFGIARLPTSELTGAGQVFGTPAFMSPEQAWGETVDHRSDIFSVGSVLYQLLTGTRPFDGDGVARILRLVSEGSYEPPSARNPEVPASVERVLAAAMARAPEDRYPSAGLLSEDLADLLAERAPRHLGSGWDAARSSGSRVGGQTTARLRRPSVRGGGLEAIASEPTHDLRSRRPGAVLRGAALVLGLLAVATAAFLAGRGTPDTGGGVSAAAATSSPAPSPAPPARPVATPTPTPVPVTPAIIRVDFEHHLKSGNLRIWVDGDVALDRWLSADSEKSIVGIKFRHGEVSDSLEIPPGTHDVRVRLAWDDNLRTETATAHFVEGESRVLRIRIDRLTKRLGLDWE